MSACKGMLVTVERENESDGKKETLTKNQQPAKIFRSGISATRKRHCDMSQCIVVLVMVVINVSDKR